jgi:hypothetical protein
MSFLNKIGTKIALQRAGLGGLSLPKDNPFAGNPKSAQEGGGDGAGIANPFANMQWPPKAFSSWQAASPQTPIREPPLIGEKAQTSPRLQFPSVDGRPVVVLFLRYCGCPCKCREKVVIAQGANMHSHREALPQYAKSSEPSHISTFCRRITLHGASNKGMGTKGRRIMERGCGS